MDSKASVKLLSIFLVLSVCFMGYMTMSTQGTLVPTPGKVGLDPNVQIKQNDNVSYWFATDTYLDNLSISSTGMRINNQFTLGTYVPSGHINITLRTWSASTAQWIADLVGGTSVTFNVTGLIAGWPYQLFVDNIPYMSKKSDGAGVLSFSYSGTWSTHTFTVVALSSSGTGQNNPLAVDFTYIVNGMAVSFSPVFSFDGTGLVFYWDFGDGVTSVQFSPTHTYNSTGTFTVTLMVLRNMIVAGEADHEVTVTLSSGGGLLNLSFSEQVLLIFVTILLFAGAVTIKHPVVILLFVLFLVLTLVLLILPLLTGGG